MKTYSQLKEAVTAKHAVVAFGRMQPPTKGHAKVIEHALSYPGEHHIVVSHAQNAHSDVLTGDEKVGVLHKMFPQHKKAFSAATPEAPTIFHKLAELHEKGHTHVTVVTGQDRQEEFQKMLDKYNGQFKTSPDGKKKTGYAFKKIRVVSAGNRDPDAEGDEGISGTKMREAALKGDYQTFRNGLHHGVDDETAHSLMNKIRTRVKPKADKKKTVKEEFEFIDEDFLEEGSTVRTIERSRKIHQNIIDNLVAKKPVNPALKSKAAHYAKSALSSKSGGKLREDYIEGKLFKVGDLVETTEGRATVVDLGTNYVTLMQVEQDRTFKKWLTDVKLVESSDTKPMQLATLSEDLQQKFADILEHQDQYAVINCIKSYSNLCNIKNLSENFNKYKIDFDRAVKYFNKFSLDTSLLSESEDVLLTYAMLNGISNFNVLNEEKVDTIGNQIDYTIRDMVKNCLHDPNGPNTRLLDKVHDKCKKNKLAHGLFKKHLKQLSRTAHDLYFKGKK